MIIMKEKKYSQPQAVRKLLIVFNGKKWLSKKGKPYWNSFAEEPQVWKPSTELKFKTLATSSHKSYKELSKDQKNLVAYILQFS